MPVLEIMAKGMTTKIILPVDIALQLSRGDKVLIPMRPDEKEPVIYTEFYVQRLYIAEVT